MMQLMPKHLIGNIGGAYLKNSKSVLFHPQQCEALESLTRVMMSGFVRKSKISESVSFEINYVNFQAGCVHFSSAVNPNCDLRVLILLYTSDKRAYLGFIPNDQQAFVDRLRRVIQQQKRMSQVSYLTRKLSFLIKYFLVMKIAFNNIFVIKVIILKLKNL